MIIRYLTVAALALATQLAVAKEATYSGSSIMDNPMLASSPKFNAAMQPYKQSARSQGAAVMYINTCGAYQLGITTSDVKINNISVKGTGLEYHIELGLHVHYGIMSDSRITSFSLQLSYAHFNAKDKYTDSLGKQQENNFKASYIGLPIAYTGIFGANGNLGFYFQLGINPQLQLKAKDGSTNISSSFKSIVVLPYASLGLALPSETGRGATNKIRLIGPYFSTTMNDIANEENFSFKCMNIGLRYVTFLTQ